MYGSVYKTIEAECTVRAVHFASNNVMFGFHAGLGNLMCVIVICFLRGVSETYFVNSCELVGAFLRNVCGVDSVVQLILMIGETSLSWSCGL